MHHTFSKNDQVTFFTFVFVTIFYFCNNIVNVVWFFRNDDLISTCSDTRPKSDIPSVTSHYFNNESTTVTVRSVTNFIKGICCCIDSCIKTDSVVCTSNIVIDCTWNTNSWESMFCQTHSSVVRSVTTDNNNTFDTFFLKLLNSCQLTFKSGKFRVTSRLKESTTVCQNV